MAVVPEFPIISVQEETQIPTRTYRLDMDSGHIIGFIDGEEALRQAASKALRTPRFDCYAYTDQYGSELGSLIGNNDVTREYIQSEIEFILKDALCQDGRFTDVRDITIEFDGDVANFTCIAVSASGETELEGVAENV